MSALKYTIESLLVGKPYRSHTRNGVEGVITHAEKRDGIWYGDNTEAYLVVVRPNRGNDFYATVAIDTN